MLSQFPKSIQAGLSLIVEFEAEDYPAPEWTLTAYLRGATAIDIPAIGAEEIHTFEVAGSVTAGYTPGRYTASIRATDGSDVFELEGGEIEILADVAALDPGHDPRAHAERTLEAIEAVIEGRASKDQQSYTINGRSLERTSISDLLLLRDTYKREVAELNSGGRSRRLLRRQVKVRM